MKSIIIITLALAACSPSVGPGPTPVPVPPGTCETAEARLQELRCVVDGVELWQGFAEACRIDADDGIDDHPACITAITACDQADAAWRNGCDR